MSLRVIVAVAIAAIVGLAFMAWNVSIQMAPAPPAASGGSQPAPSGTLPGGGGAGPGEVAAPEPADTGLGWDVPKRWTIDVAQGMRNATYLIPASRGQGAECAVYYFGPGQGGGLDANLERWKGEFQPLQKQDIRYLKPGGIQVTRILATGTYVAHSMRSAETAGEKLDWALLGAIVKGPNGDVYFKLTGPASTVDAAAKEFDAMLGSLRRK